MTHTGKRKVFSAAYLRFKKQLTALHQDKMRVVKYLARQARAEITFKTIGQARLPLIY